MVRNLSVDVNDSKTDDYDPQEHQACYVFIPPGTSSARSTKRRKTANPVKAPSPPKTLFPTLLNGQELSTTVQLRWDTFRRLWSEQETRTKSILDTFNQKTLDDVSEFVAGAEPAKYGGKIPTALVLAGPNIASHGPLFRQFATRLGAEDEVGPVVVLTSKGAGNLKGALKKAIRDATQAEEGVDDEDEELIVGRKGAKLLNYDLQILQNWCKLHEGKKVVFAVQDTEAFDTGILSDLISLFSSYLDRIPIVLLLGIATSLEIFHEKLPKATIRMLQGEKFDVERAEECLAQVFNDAVIDGKSALQFGPAVCDLLVERQRDHTQSIQTFFAALKYMYMSHFYANPLSVILACVEDSEIIDDVLSKYHLRAIRNLPSFKLLVTSTLADKRTDEVRKLLQDDSHLLSHIKSAITECRQYGRNLGLALSVFKVARNSVSSSSSTRASCNELYSRALLGDFNEQSPMVRDLLLIMKKMKSGPLLSLLDAVIDKNPPELARNLESLRNDIKSLVEALDDGNSKNLTSEFDVADTALRTTAVSRRIHLNEHKSALTKTDTAYSKLIQHVHDAFESYFTISLKPVKHLFLHEIFFYDLVSPHKDVFAPRARATVEHALSNPAHYLGCECCEPDDTPEGEDSVLKGTNPPTSIIYQLFLESGALINAFDLWSAFRSVLQEDEDGDVEDDTAQALFFRSVAEMRFLGFLKPTRKRVDHLQKLAWKGL